MKPRLATVALIGLCMLPLGSAPAHSSAQPEARSSATNSVKPASDYGNLPISFQPNRGQFEADTTFGSRGFGYSLSINSTGLRLQLRDAEAKAATVEMKLLGADPASHVRGTGPLPGQANYFSGPRENWITHVPTYEKVQVENVYPGIDAIYYGNQNRLEYDFLVAPGASPDTINIAFPGSTNLAVTGNGDLLISTENHTVRESKPVVYQEIDGNRVEIAAEYVLRNNQQVGFEVAEYDPSTPLIIDPQLIYSTFGESMTRPYGIALDSAGNAYICGTTFDGGQNDQATNAYVAKLNGAGSAILWFASFGSFGFSDSATAIAVDASGNAYVTGWTIYDAPPFFPKFPTVNAIQPNPGGGSDAFVTKFDTNGNMVYSTYLGGSSDDQAEGIAVDSLGNVYVTGQTASTNFPTAKPLQSTPRGNLNSFVTALNPQGTAFIYSTYIGGSGADAGTAIAVDATGNAYVTGSTSSVDFPTASPIRHAAAGGLDAFILKLNPAGSAFMYSTYLGGSGDDVAKGIALDSSNNVYVTGRTNSGNFPTASAFQATLHGGVDAFVTKVNAMGTAFSYSTYLGGANDETTGGEWCVEKPTCGGIVVNPSGNAYVTGVTASPDFPQVRSLQPFRGVTDAYITEFSVDGKTLVYSTLLGGSTGGNTNEGPLVSHPGFSSGSALAYLNGNVYVAGLTNTRDFPVTANSTDGPCCVNPVWNGIDGFVAKLADDQTGGGNPTFTRVEQNSSAVKYTGTWYSNTGSFNSGGSAALAVDKGSRATFTFSGTDARWIGYKDAWSGIANVYVDGVLKAQVDTYSASAQAQVVLYTINGLSSGTHTLAVEVSGTKNAAAHSSWIWVDAFDSANSGSGTSGGGGTGGGTGGTGTFSRVEQNNAAVAYTGTWYSNSGSFNSGGSAALAEDKGARATFTFSGTDARWIGYKDAWSGMANVYVDGVLKTQVDTYAASAQAQVVLYTISGLSSGNHTLTVEVAGTKNPSSNSFWIWVDAFDSAPSGGNGGGGTGGTSTGSFTRVEQNSSAVSYTGTWYSNSATFNSGGSAALAINTGARATFTFTGTSVKWIGYRDSWSGIANVYIDGTLKAQVDTYSASGQAQAVNYTITGLSSGSHTITIEVTGTKDASAQSSWIWVDAFEFQ